jgi:PKHD-type hydroxylase
MNGEWVYYKSYFSPEYCNQIIEKSNDLTFQEAHLGEDGLSQVNGYRKSDVTWLFPQEFPDLYEHLWKLEREANKEWFGFHVDNLEYIQLARYDSKIQGEYKRHQDVFWVNQNQRHRKLTAVIQLSDPDTYTGGDFKVYDCSQYPNQDDIRQQGTIIFIPSFVFHSASPVTSGVRYSLAVWFEGPKWR